MRNIRDSRLPASGLLAGLLAVVLSSSGSAEPLRDGRNFDPGADMSEPAPGASPDLGKMTGILGIWDVGIQGFAADSLVLEGTGRAKIALINRGHSVMERFHLPESSAGELDGLEILTHNPGLGTWMLGSMYTDTENAVLYSGNFEDEVLLLRNAERRLGSADLVHSRWTLSREGKDGFETRLEESRDGGTTWKPVRIKRYSRSNEPFFDLSPEPYGTAAPGRPQEAGQFDFLLGEWDTVHDMTLPTGQVQFPVHATAVHTLNGHAILEFNWYDVDPRLPDAATTLARIYNRAMRRWECLYVNNRFNSILHFGGVQEGDRIVLTRFGANTGDVPINYWIFSDIQPDRYHWHAESSRDGGLSFDETWTIEAVRAPAGGEKN